MQPRSIAADEATGAVEPDERLVLILTLFRLYRAREPDKAMLGQLVAEVRNAEAGDDGEAGSCDREFLLWRTALCVAVVRRFIAAYP